MVREEEKHKILVRASWVSTIGNAILSASKISIGLIAGSLAVLGDGIDSATDVVISVVMVLTAGIMNRPPNSKYPYGYKKAESIAGKILSLVIFYAGVQMFVSTLKSLIFSEAKEMPSLTAIYVTVLSIAGKLCLALYQYRQGKKTGSLMLTANAKNMRNDVVISIGVLLGLFFTFTLKLPVLDSVAGLIISLFIIRSSVNIFMESSAELMDGVKDTSVYEKIFEAVDCVQGACHPHRVRSSQIGNRYMIVLDVEADGNISLSEAHRIAQEVENSIKKTVENVYDIVVHIEPKGVRHDEEQFGISKKMLK